MVILLSPAKALNTQDPAPEPSRERPYFADEAARLVEHMRGLDTGELSKLFGVGENTAELNRERYHQWEPDAHADSGRAAVYTFAGPVYKALHPWDWNEAELRYAQQHLGILSGLYGLLDAREPVLPYRLDMGTRITPPEGKKLVDFWRPRVTDRIAELVRTTGAPAVLNLASKEYADAVDRQSLSAPVIDFRFEEWSGDRYRQVRTYIKQARGLMARHLVKTQANSLEKAKEFASANYAFAPEASDETRLVFRRDERPAS
jgi:hypothetical protein